jgi:Co/Zn/Cd efflux system component
MTALHDLSADTLSSAYRAGQLSPVEVTRAALARATTMGAVGIAALVANGISFGLLWAYLGTDANMRSAWICTRNDLLRDVAVLCAALGVFGTGTGRLDVIVAAIMSSLALQGAVVVISQALGELSQPIRRASIGW